MNATGILYKDVDRSSNWSTGITACDRHRQDTFLVTWNRSHCQSCQSGQLTQLAIMLLYIMNITQKELYPWAIILVRP